MNQLIADILAYCVARGISEATFGRYAINDSRLVSRLRDGGECLPRTEAKIRAYMAAHPPAAVEPTRGADAA